MAEGLRTASSVSVAEGPVISILPISKRRSSRVTLWAFAIGRSSVQSSRKAEG